MPQLLRTTAALDQIALFRGRENFDPFADAFIENLCIQSAAVMRISEIEEIIGAELTNRLSGALDVKVGAFITQNLATIIKRTSKSDIAKTVRMFGDESKDAFNASFTDQDIRAYENLLAGRHDTAHAEGGSLSFAELSTGVAIAQKMIDNFQACIA